MSAPRSGPWHVSFEKKHGPLFLGALLSTKIPRVRVVERGEYWYFTLPNTRAAVACWLGFLAGRRNKMGYILGGPRTSDPADKVVFPAPKSRKAG